MYRASGIGISLALIAAGAILAWAVDTTVSGVDINTVGIILFVVGIVGLVASVLINAAPRRMHDTTRVDGGPTVERDRVEY